MFFDDRLISYRVNNVDKRIIVLFPWLLFECVPIKTLEKPGNKKQFKKEK